MVILAIIPSIIIFIIIWRFDTVEKEPAGLLAKLFAGGALTIISAVLIGLLGDKVMHHIFSSRTFAYLFIECVILTALVEEGGKFLVLKFMTWKNKEFNYTFDGVVYATAVALGFTIVENIIYVLRGDADNVAIRVLLMVTGNFIFAIFMGCFYGLARYEEGVGEDKAVIKHLAEAVIVPTAMHGFYVFCLRTEKPVFIILFIIYDIIISFITVKQFLKLSRNDTLIPGEE